MITVVFNACDRRTELLCQYRAVHSRARPMRDKHTCQTVY